MDKKKITREMIINTALELFVKKGYTNVQMREVYENTGISKKTLYRYFSSKEDLAFAVEIRLFEKMNEQINMTIPSDDKTGYEQIKHMFLHNISNFIHQNSYTFKFFAQFDVSMSGDYPDLESSREFVKYLQTLKNVHETLLYKGQKDGSIRKDIEPAITSVTVNNAIMALAQKLYLREHHIKNEQGFGQEMLDHLILMYIDYIKS